jgi:poly(beta-D-mannuronate) lyase
MTPPIPTLFLTFFLGFLPLNAAAGDIYFDVAQRKAELQKPEYTKARTFCAAKDIALPKKLPDPIDALYAKSSYGNDNRMEPLTLYVMIQGGRALAGDEKAAAALGKELLKWAKADALVETEALDKTYYPLQRYMIPIIINFSIIADTIDSDDREKIEEWIDRVVRPLGKRFGGDVDHNNHRFLSDSAMMTWGAYTDDSDLYNIGIDGFTLALREATAEGTLPYETRRGSRSVWYLRHALTNLTLIAEIARHHGDDLYTQTENKVSLDTITNYFLNSVYAPLFILPDAAENLKPGDDFNYRTIDQGYLHRRGGSRHYMAFAEAYAVRQSFAATRLKQLMQRISFKERPLIDDYFGGNATCFFWQPEAP